MNGNYIFGALGGGIMGGVFMLIFEGIGFSFWPALGLVFLTCVAYNLLLISYQR